jgi:hypothetical protein
MSHIPPYEFNAKLFLLTSRVSSKVTHVLAPFFYCLDEFNFKKVHMMLVLMFDP